MPTSLYCKKIQYAQAADFYNRFEHLGNPGYGVYHWGAFQGEIMIGAVSFGCPCFSPHRGIFSELSKKYYLHIFQLTRGGTMPFAPKFTGSWIISQGLKMLRKTKGDCIVLAYSDPFYNEIGTIYQASNFLYLGKTNPKGQSDYFIFGQKLSGWDVRRKFGTRDQKKLIQIDPDMIRIPLRPKYRYFAIAARKSIRQRIVADIEDMIFPFPKRENEGLKMMNTMELVKRRTSIQT